MPSLQPIVTEDELQVHLFARIRDLVPSHQSVVEEVAAVLQVSADSAYRRMRGEKTLSLPEAVALASRFKISLDALRGPAAGTVGFNFSRMRTAADFEDYLAGMAHLLGLMEQADKSSMIYGASDIPIFHYFGQGEHTAFKLFYWQQAVMGLPELAGKKFSPELVSDRAMELAGLLYQRYYAVPSIEIWTVASSLTAARQLAYYHEADLFATPALGRQVVGQMLTSLTTVAQIAENDSKDLAGRASFRLYDSDIQIGNNSVLATVGSTQVTYVSHQTFKLMTTYNQDFCADTEAFLKGLIRRSTLISGVSERQRRQFFSRLRAPIEELAAKMG